MCSAISWATADNMFGFLELESLAKKNNLKTVFITGIRLQNVKWDASHCDYHLDNVSPADFVSLIKNAEYVFTDSFHACVFSGIYKKQLVGLCR